MSKQKKWLLLLIGSVLILVGFIIYLLNIGGRQKFGVINSDILVKVPLSELSEDTLYITADRAFYQRGEMTLIIPAIEVFTPIGESTDPDGLAQMPGLYEFSQLPVNTDGNVSIAGHRDIHDMVFYSLDRLKEGDYLYLLYRGYVYQYLYKESIIVDPDEWSVIQPQGFDCLTLTTCDPIGTDLNRLIVHAELQDTREYNETYKFTPNKLALP